MMLLVWKPSDRGISNSMAALLLSWLWYQSHLGYPCWTNDLMFCCWEESGCRYCALSFDSCPSCTKVQLVWLVQAFKQETAAYPTWKPLIYHSSFKSVKSAPKRNCIALQCNRAAKNAANKGQACKKTFRTHSQRSSKSFPSQRNLWLLWNTHRKECSCLCRFSSFSRHVCEQ